MIKCVLPALLLLLGIGLSADGTPRTVPFRVIPMEGLAVSARDWGNPSEAHYSIITNAGEWDLAFMPTAAASAKPSRPQAAFFTREQLLAVSRVTEASLPGQKILFVKSLTFVDGEVQLTYGFFPPAPRGGSRVVNTLLLAIPNEYSLVNGMRIVEDIETPASIATAAGVEAARAAGRIKPPDTGR